MKQAAEELVEFGANGVRLDRIEDDYQLARENRRIDPELLLTAFAGFNGSLGMLAWLPISNPSLTELPSLQLGLAVSAISFLAAGTIGFFAEEQKRLAPVERQTFDHITGFGAFVGLLLLAVILLAATLGQINYPDFAVPEELGLAAIAALASGFLLVALVPRILDISVAGNVLRYLRFATAPLAPLGRLMSLIDAWLVYGVAPAVGCTLRNTPIRYAVLTANLVCATLFAWVCPAPFGSIGTLWAIIAAIGVARRWAWVETEREKAGQPNDGHPRVVTDMDLRDEALWALILLIVVLPVGLRQFYLSVGTAASFSVTEAVRDDPLAWFGFFGVELLKALPFVDWADVYGAHGTTRITANSALALHSVFAARVLIDLVFIGALIQAISISVYLSRNKRAFLAGTVHVLDDRIERMELSRLARKHGKQWRFKTEIDQFKHYDSHRLSRLRMLSQPGTRLHAVLVELFALKKLQYLPPGEQLIDVAKDAQIDRQSLVAALNLVEKQRHFDLEYLGEARRLLNGKGEIEDLRIRVIEMMIAKVPPSPNRDDVLLGILNGPDADTLASVRTRAVDALSRVARENNRITLVLHDVAERDRAGPVRRRAAYQIKTRRLASRTPTTKVKRQLGP